MARMIRLALVLAGLTMAACNRASLVLSPEVVATDLPIVEASGMPTATALLTEPSPEPTATLPLPAPTRTSIPTTQPTPLATLTPTAVPIENQVLIEYTLTSGDGTPPQYFYLGVGMPHFVLYMDGRLLVQVVESLGIDRTVYYQEAMLPTSEMCLLLDSVENTGFLDVVGGTGDSIYAWEDPIYDFGEFDNFSEGAPFDLMILNGPMPKYTQIYSQYWDFVVPEMVAVRELLNQYSAKATQPYKPQQVMLWIEEGDPSWLELELIPQTWPEELPALSHLAKQPSNEAIIADGSDALWELLDYRMKYNLFVESGKEYLVVVRPLLPHEMANEFPKLSWDAQELPLPFECVP